MASHFREPSALLCLGVGWLATIAIAQAASTSASSASSASSTSSTSTAPAVTHTVAVAPDGFTFSPNSINANISDIILFEFYQGNHSVARAEYEHPCIPYENLGGGRVGFWSGFQPVTGIPTEEARPRYALRVNSSEPVFFYCAAVGACVPNGMIGVINQNESETLDTQALFVKNASYQLYPGQSPPSESTSTGSSSSPTSSSDSYSSSGGSSGLSKGAIAGIAIGAVAVIALAALTFYLCGRNRTLASAVRYSRPPQPKHPSDHPSPMIQSTGAGSPHDPYSPSFAASNHSPKPGHVPSMSPNLNHHDSWQTQNMQQPMAENVGAQGIVSPGFAPHSGQPSPGNAPWSPGGFSGQQYTAVPQHVPYQHQEMATGQEQHLTPAASPGPYIQHHDSYISAHSHQSGAVSPPPAPAQQVVHEMDAAPTSPPTSPPPDYMGRSFSFAQGGQAEAPGVEKVLRD